MGKIKQLLEHMQQDNELHWQEQEYLHYIMQTKKVNNNLTTKNNKHDRTTKNK
tara:strand:+ start:3956 stop:4114 length:159 start_codon:yes stop_codon:yes gene_type:complete